MKKNVWAKMLSLMLVFVCVMGLAACGGNDVSNSDAVGSYNFQSLDMSGISMNIDQMVESELISAEDAKILVLELKSDGKFVLDMSAVEGMESMEGTWKESGSNIELTATIEGETSSITATLEDGVITLAEEGVTLTFKK